MDYMRRAHVVCPLSAIKNQYSMVWREQERELAQKPYIIPIPGTTKIHRLEENLGTYNIELTEEEVASINEALYKIDIYKIHF